MAKDRYGCATRRSKSTCGNSDTIQRQRLERRVLSGLKDRMLAPDLVAEFMRAFAEETAVLQRESAGASARLSRELADVERRLTGVLTAMENGAWSDSLQARLTELEHRKAALTRDIAEAASPTPVVTLHPNAAELYRRRVAELETALAQPDIASEAAAALAALIPQGCAHPRSDSGGRACGEPARRPGADLAPGVARQRQDRCVGHQVGPK